MLNNLPRREECSTFLLRWTSLACFLAIREDNGRLLALSVISQWKYQVTIDCFKEYKCIVVLTSITDHGKCEVAWSSELWYSTMVHWLWDELNLLVANWILIWTFDSGKNEYFLAIEWWVKCRIKILIGLWIRMRKGMEWSLLIERVKIAFCNNVDGHGSTGSWLKNTDHGLCSLAVALMWTNDYTSVFNQPELTSIDRWHPSTVILIT